MINEIWREKVPSVYVLAASSVAGAKGAIKMIRKRGIIEIKEFSLFDSLAHNLVGPPATLLLSGERSWRMEICQSSAYAKSKRLSIKSGRFIVETTFHDSSGRLPYRQRKIVFSAKDREILQVSMIYFNHKEVMGTFKTNQDGSIEISWAGNLEPQNLVSFM